jgi:hypothetical protein
MRCAFKKSPLTIAPPRKSTLAPSGNYLSRNDFAPRVLLPARPDHRNQINRRLR